MYIAISRRRYSFKGDRILWRVLLWAIWTLMSGAGVTEGLCAMPRHIQVAPPSLFSHVAQYLSVNNKFWLWPSLNWHQKSSGKWWRLRSTVIGDLDVTRYSHSLVSYYKDWIISLFIQHLLSITVNQEQWNKHNK